MPRAGHGHEAVAQEGLGGALHGGPRVQRHEVRPAAALQPFGKLPQWRKCETRTHAGVLQRRMAYRPRTSQVGQKYTASINTTMREIL
jgi:hypothetical protein